MAISIMGKLSNLSPQGSASPSTTNAEEDLTTTDTDGDGLSDADEEVWNTCVSSTSTSENCDGVADSTDTDGDGLSDGMEVNQLGIIPTLDDSDGDTITDDLEVRGFTYNGQRWYLDPFEADTNQDGILDTSECPAWSIISKDYDLNATCPDTDGDGVPDLFDDDNDDDGAKDAVDLSPNLRRS